VLFRSGAGRGFDPRSLAAARAGLPRPGVAVLLFFVVLALMFFLLGGLPDTPWGAALVFLKAQLLAVLVPLLLFAWKGKVDPRATFSLQAPRPRVVPAVLLAAGATLVLVGALYMRFLPPPEASEGFARVVELLAAMPPWLYFALLAVLPPICEELLCRGFLLAAFRPRFGDRGAVVLAAVLFGLLHLDLYRFPATCAAGLVLGYVCVRTGSIFMAILFHMAYNGILASPLGALVRPDWTYIGGAAAVLAACVVFLERHGRLPAPAGSPADATEGPAPDASRFDSPPGGRKLPVSKARP
jgi:sodium transport system permease protein